MNVENLRRVLKRAEEGEALTIGFIGGSITQGCHASAFENSYVEKVYRWLQQRFPKAQLKRINVAIGATGSLIGVHRVERDLLVHRPDLIFVEFAANDVPTKQYTKFSYESLIRRILGTLKQVAIIEIFMTLQDGTSAQEEQATLAKYYDIPTINYREEVFNQIKAGAYTWEDIASDEVHPNDRGHDIIADLIEGLIEYTMTMPVSNSMQVADLPVPLYGAPYEQGKLIAFDELVLMQKSGFVESKEQFGTIGNGYETNEIITESELILEIEANHIFLLYVKGTERIRGKIKVRVDNQPVMIVDTFFENGWGNYLETYPLVEEGAYKKHQINLKVVKTDEENLVSLFGFLIS